MADQSSATQLVGAYLSSKGLPMTGENIRRALEQNASNPGLIKGLTNYAPPTGDTSEPQGGNSRASSGATRPQPKLATEGGKVGSGAPPTAPRAASDSAMSRPQPQAQADGGGNNILQSIAQLILGGGAGAGIGHILFGGRSGAPQSPPTAMPGLNIPVPGSEPRLGGGQPQLPAPQAALPAPAAIGSPAQVGGPAPMPQISDRNMVPGVNPVGPPQPGRMEAGPSMPIPPTPMPQGAAPASDAASRAPVSIVPRGAVADAADLGGHMDWAKILGDVGKVVRR